MPKKKNTNKKEEIKAEEKRVRSVTSKAQLKDVEIVNKILEQKKEVTTPGSMPATYTKIKLRNGTVKETYGERYNQ
tara:strand:- start:698 stop:925 length:228 start_codon:yes stop_codon:yes gene_type:complete